MTPRPMDDDDLKWKDIGEMINREIINYDNTVILPRERDIVAKQSLQHEENIAWHKRFEDTFESLKKSFEELSDKMSEVWDAFKSWNGSLKVIGVIIMSILIPTFLGVMALVYDLVKWGLTHDWKY